MNKSLLGIAAIAAIFAFAVVPSDAFASNWTLSAETAQIQSLIEIDAQVAVDKIHDTTVSVAQAAANFFNHIFN